MVRCRSPRSPGGYPADRAPHPVPPCAWWDPVTRRREARASRPGRRQAGRIWPLNGRVIGLITDGGSDPDGIRAVRDAVCTAGMVPLVTAPTAGSPDTGGEPIGVQRTFATARPVEYDAVLPAGAPAPAADAFGARDAKAGEPGNDGTVGPRVPLMLSEAFRHGQAIGGRAGPPTALEAAGIPVDAAGVVTAGTGSGVLEQITRLLPEHRVRDRFAPRP